MLSILGSFKRMSHGGGRGITITGAVETGPTTALGRDIHLTLTFAQVESLIRFYHECKGRVEKQEAEVSEANKRNSE
jgi:hypothetical protein